VGGLYFSARWRTEVKVSVVGFQLGWSVPWAEPAFHRNRIGLYSVKPEMGRKHVKALLHATGSEACWPQRAVGTVSAGSNVA